MNASTRRLIVGSLGATLACVLMAGAWLAANALRIGLGHKAKTLCSGVFVSRLDPAVVLTDLQADDLAVLKWINASIDFRARSVKTTFGTIASQAVYREGLGCTLVLNGLIPPALPEGQGARHVAALKGALPGSTAGLVAADSGSVREQPPGHLEAAVARAFSEPDPRRRRRTLAVIVMHRGRIIAEQYAHGIALETPLAGWSMTKSVMNALAGILVGEGRLVLDAPVPVPQWQQPGDRRAAITLDHLLRMSSGLRFDEGMASPRSDIMRMLFTTGDVAAFAASKDAVVAPGTMWQYASGTTNIISQAIRGVLRDQAEYLTFPRRALFDRIGMSSAVLETDATGTFVGSSYMYATARDWARFGTLYLQDGMWNGDRVLPEGWVAYTTSPAPADEKKLYGAHFWLQVPDEYAGTNARLPTAAFHAAGHEAQFVTIVPSREVVIVRLGRTRHPEAWDHSAFVRDVLAAIPGTSSPTGTGG